MKWIKRYEIFRNNKNNFYLLEAILSIDKNIESSLQSIKNDKTTIGSFSKMAEYILKYLGKDLTKLRFDDIYVNPEEDEKFPLKAKMGKQENHQKITSVITNIIESIFNDIPSLPKYFVKKKGTNPYIPELGTFLTEEEYKKVIGNFTKEELDANKKLHPQEDAKFTIDNLLGSNIIDEFSKLLAVKLKSMDKSVVGNQDIKLVSGDDILKWYDVKNVEKMEGTTLNNSCMKYEDRNEFMRFYARNEDKIKLVIKVNSDGLLIARALLWKLDYSEKGFEYFMDRCYYNYDEDQELIFSWLRTEGGFSNINKRTSADPDDVMIVNLKQVLTPSYPYLDTFRYLFINHDKEKWSEIKKTQKYYSINYDDVLINEGFLCNLGYSALFENNYPETIKLEDYIDYRLIHTDGNKSILRGAGELFDNLGLNPDDVPGKPVLIIKGFKKSIGFLPPINWENELRNLIKINKLMNEGTSEEDLLDLEIIGNLKKNLRGEMEKIFSSKGLNFDEYLDITENAFMHRDKISYQINYNCGLDSAIGIRLWVYEISDLKKENSEIGQILRGEKKFGGKKYLTPRDGLFGKYITALDCELLGIDVSNREHTFSTLNYIFGSSVGYDHFKPDTELTDDNNSWFPVNVGTYVRRENWNPNNDKFFEAYLKEKNFLSGRMKQILDLRKQIDEIL